MTGLPPDDPRFEHAVRRGAASFRLTGWIQDADLEDLEQEIRIALLAKGGPAPVRVAKLAAIDWWRDLYGRRRNGEYLESARKGHRRMELLAKNLPLGDGVSAETSDGHTPSAFDNAEATTAPPDVALLWVHAQRVLERLQERDRDLLLLRHVRDMGMKEIGNELGLSEARVSQLLPVAEGRARVAMRRSA